MPAPIVAGAAAAEAGGGLLSKLLTALFVGSVGFSAAAGITAEPRRLRAGALELAQTPNPALEQLDFENLLLGQEGLSEVLAGAELADLIRPGRVSVDPAVVLERQARRELEDLLTNEDLARIGDIAATGQPSILQIAARQGIL